MAGQEDQGDRVVGLQLSRDEALVLFDWIHRIEDQRRFRQVVDNSAEVVALWSLSAVLEKALDEPFDPTYGDLVRAASERLLEGQDPDPLSLYAASPETTEVTEARAVLERQYRQPVYPVSQVCQAVRHWADKIIALNQQPPDETSPNRQGAKYWDVLDKIWIDIQKSNLLGRVLYGREPVRTRPCPVHKGHWTGRGPQYDACGCEGCGWLPEVEAK